jgi:putative transposase
VILDIYSRYVVGWMLATRESAALAEKLIADTCAKQVIGPDQLTLHVDRGSSMTSQPVAFLFSPCSDRQGEGELKAWFHV